MNQPNETMRGRTEGHGGPKERLAKLGVADLFLGGSHNGGFKDIEGCSPPDTDTCI